MTRKERMNLVNHLKYIGADYVITDKDADEIIKALEQEPCEDCISRKDAIEQFMCWWSELLGNEKEDETFDNILKALPSVTPQPKTGHCDDCISREAVHEMLENVPINPNDKWFNWLQKACLRLAELPSVKQEPCEDCISREQALKELKESAENHANDSREEVLLRRDRDIIKALPSVTPQPKTGHWIRFKEFENGYYHIKCSECGQYWSIDGHAKTFKYCFNCGAKMESEG